MTAYILISQTLSAHQVATELCTMVPHEAGEFVGTIIKHIDDKTLALFRVAIAARDESGSAQ